VCLHRYTGCDAVRRAALRCFLAVVSCYPDVCRAAFSVLRLLDVLLLRGVLLPRCTVLCLLATLRYCSLCGELYCSVLTLSLRVSR
jgi:hypothetical protein